MFACPALLLGASGPRCFNNRSERHAIHTQIERHSHDTALTSLLTGDGDKRAPPEADRRFATQPRAPVDKLWVRETVLPPAICVALRCHSFWTVVLGWREKLPVHSPSHCVPCRSPHELLLFRIPCVSPAYGRAIFPSECVALHCPVSKHCKKTRDPRFWRVSDGGVRLA